MDGYRPVQTADVAEPVQPRQDGPDGAEMTAAMLDEKQATAHCASLETLPAELRVRILSSVPDLRTLASLIHASPLYFAQYRLDRRRLLAQALQAELGDELFVDVYAAFVSRRSKIAPETGPRRAYVTDFLDLYRGWRSPGGKRPSPHTCSIDDLGWMTWFHNSTVRPLAALFVGVALGSHRPPSVIPVAPDPNSIGDDELSGTERMRILRALYRFQLFCNLFSGNLVWRDDTVGFVAEFEPWEVEEIGCIYSFVKEKYEHVLAEVKWDFDPGHPRFADQRHFEPEGAFHIDRDYEEFQNGTIGTGGLRLAFHMFKCTTHEQFMSLMQDSFELRVNELFEGAFSGHAQDDRRDFHYNHRDSAHENGDAMAFAGDSSSQPPLAWVLLWKGKYSNLWGEYIPDGHRRWGYVMWDAERLALEGAERLDLEGAKDYFEGRWGYYG